MVTQRLSLGEKIAQRIGQARSTLLFFPVASYPYHQRGVVLFFVCVFVVLFALFSKKGFFSPFPQFLLP